MATPRERVWRVLITLNDLNKLIKLLINTRMLSIIKIYIHYATLLIHWNCMWHYDTKETTYCMPNLHLRSDSYHYSSAWTALCIMLINSRIPLTSWELFMSSRTLIWPAHSELFFKAVEDDVWSWTVDSWPCLPLQFCDNTFKAFI